MRLSNVRLPLALLLLACFIPSAMAAAPRNVVLFVTDDQSPDAGCYGNDVIKTPSLDALAADGVRFDAAFCTTASCSASRSVILSGLHNHANGHYGHEHAYHHFSSFDRVRSLPVLLAEAGYRTASIGKYHVAPKEVYQFQKFLPGNSRSPVEMAENCQGFIKEDPTQPFFLYFCTSDPHRSGGKVPGAEYDPNPFGNKPGGYPGVKEVTYSPDDVKVHSFLPNTPTCRAELAQYYQSVSRIDQGLGRLVEILKEANAYENTLIIFTSDHGIAFPGGKTTLYEGGMNVPFVVHSPTVDKPGRASQAMVSHVDLTPTILTFANAMPKNYKFHGRSWLAALETEKPEGFDQVFASHTFHEVTMYYPMRVVRERKYKLIWNIAHGLPYPFASDLWDAPTWQDIYKQGPDAYYGKRTVDQYINRPKFELFDIESDPYETVNLAESEEHAAEFKRLKEKLHAFQKNTNDPWELKWRYE